MGSMMEACCTGFICRLCSKINRTVIFIYGAEGLKHNLLEKINSYLPIEINEEDELPKTICEACMNKILLHHRLIVQIQTAQKRFIKMREDEQAARNVSAAESAASSRTLSAESTASSRTMSVDSTDAVEGPSERLQASASNNTEPTPEHSPEADVSNPRVEDDTPSNGAPVRQEAQEAATSNLTADTTGESSINRPEDQSESGPSSTKPTNRLKRKQPNPSRSDKVARKRLG
uniref:ZAD domain-containing protein n=1 Tax=Anopheles dirus TaxID=7168 RepID=A0A182N5D5_9DIPT